MRTNEGIGDYFGLQKGFREGDPSSPAAFSLYHSAVMTHVEKKLQMIDGDQCLTFTTSGTDTWMKQRRRRGRPRHAEEHRLQTVMFADDTTLITREPFLREVERISTETMLAWGEKTNNMKTERIIFGQREEVPQEDVAFEPGIPPLQYQDQSKVVGVIIHKTGRHEADTDHRLTAANKVWKKLFRQLPRLSLAPRDLGRVIRATVLASLLYGTETRPINKKCLQKFQAFFNKVLRGCTATRKSEMHDNRENMYDIMQRLGLDSIETQIQVRRLRWLGRIASFPPGRWEHIALTGALSPEWQHKKKNGGQTMSVHRTYHDDISKIMALTAIPKENWNGAWRHLAQDATKWKKLTKKWLLKQRHEEKNKVWSKQAEITPGGKSFHRAEKQRRDQQGAAEENLTIDETKRIECPHCRSKFVIGKFFAHREICSNLTITERNRQNNSRICRRAKLAGNIQMNQREDIPAAQPCPVSQPEQQPPAQPDDEIEWMNVMNELDAIFLDPVVAPHAVQQDRAAASNPVRGRWRNMSAMPTPKRPVDQNPLECTFCHSVFPKADKCAIHMRTCAAMPYDMWIARVRLSGLCPAYAEHACHHCGTRFTTSKGCNSHANQCRKRRERCGLSIGTCLWHPTSLDAAQLWFLAECFGSESQTRCD